MLKPKPRAFLALRKAITGKRATSTELGYKRDIETKRLIDPKKSKDYDIRDKALELEIKRKQDLKKRQLSNWIRKLNVSLNELNQKKTVNDYKEEAFHTLFDNIISRSRKNIKSNHVLLEERLRSAFESRYYSELHAIIQRTGIEKLNNLNFIKTDAILTSVARKLYLEKEDIMISLRKKGAI